MTQRLSARLGRVLGAWFEAFAREEIVPGAAALERTAKAVHAVAQASLGIERLAASEDAAASDPSPAGPPPTRAARPRSPVKPRDRDRPCARDLNPTEASSNDDDAARTDPDPTINIGDTAEFDPEFDPEFSSADDAAFDARLDELAAWFGPRRLAREARIAGAAFNPAELAGPIAAPPAGAA